MADTSMPDIPFGDIGDTMQTLIRSASAGAVFGEPVNDGDRVIVPAADSSNEPDRAPYAQTTPSSYGWGHLKMSSAVQIQSRRNSGYTWSTSSGGVFCRWPASTAR